MLTPVAGAVLQEGIDLLPHFECTQDGERPLERDDFPQVAAVGGGLAPNSARKVLLKFDTSPNPESSATCPECCQTYAPVVKQRAAGGPSE
jgi:hypothetical protein